MPYQPTSCLCLLKPLSFNICRFDQMHGPTKFNAFSIQIVSGNKCQNEFKLMLTSTSIIIQIIYDIMFYVCTMQLLHDSYDHLTIVKVLSFGIMV